MYKWVAIYEIPATVLEASFTIKVLLSNMIGTDGWLVWFIKNVD